MNKNIFMFDVESTSLYGIGFCVGAIVSDSKGTIIDSFSLLSIESLNGCCDFVKENILPHLQEITKVETNVELRTKFYEFYMKHKDSSTVWSDVNYPVETNFLLDVVKDDVDNRQWNMPYPLFDVANKVDVNIDRVNVYETSTNKKLRKHNPIDDCKASLHILLYGM